MGRIDARLQELGIELGQAPAPAANYVPFVKTGNLVFIAGQVPRIGDSREHVGKLGADLSIEQGQAAAPIMRHQSARPAQSGVRW